MDTKQILAAAYEKIFGLASDETQRSCGQYYGQRAGTCEIDYAMFDDVMPFEYGTHFMEAVVEDGSEGVWICVARVAWNRETRSYDRRRVGTIKTLAEGREAWRDMGALAGELAWVANNDIAWELYKEQQRKAADA